MPASHVLHHDPRAAALALKEEEARHREEQNALRRRNVALHVVGRVFVSALFLVSGFAKIATFGATVAAMEANGISDAGMLLPIVIMLEVIGGTLIAAGYKTREVSVGLLVYLVAVTLLMHRDFSIDVNRAFAVANLGIAGALFLLFSHGSGAASLDTFLARRRAQQSGL